MEKQKKLKCLFVYDNKLKTKDNKFYTAGGVNDELFKRYILPSEDIVVITRMEKVSCHKNFPQITSGNIIFAPIKGLDFSKAFSLYSIPNLKLFVREVREADFIVTRLPSFLGIFVLIVNIPFKKKYFLEVAGDAKEALLTSKINPSIPFKVFTRVFFELNRYFINSADGVIYVTQNALQKIYPTHGLTEYASNVEIDIKTREINLVDYKCDNDSFKVGLIGDYNNHYKGISEAIHAIKMLFDLNYNINLYIVGSGTLIKYYEDLSKSLGVENLVHFEGRLKNSTEVINWLERLNLYIQPSYTEGLPRGLIEAMSVGLPAVATNVGGVSELLDADDLVSSYDSAALANRMKDFLDSTELRYKKGKLNYIKSKLYDRSKLAERRLNFWRSCRDLVKSQS